jgi:hypothetical protein
LKRYMKLSQFSERIYNQEIAHEEKTE